MTSRVFIGAARPDAQLLEAKLAAEYFEVVTASDGEQLLAQIALVLPDVVLLDAMTPSLNAFDVCHRMKADPKTAHIPVVIVTASAMPSQRAMGLEAGADDFIIKPVDDTALFARIRSLIRLKMMIDEVKVREDAETRLGSRGVNEFIFEQEPSGRILIVDDNLENVEWLRSKLLPANELVLVSDFDEAGSLARGGDFDIYIVSLGIQAFDSLQLCSELRSAAETRTTPILVLQVEGESRKLCRALDMGVNDFVTPLADGNELLARVRTQLRKRYYSVRLRNSIQRVYERAAVSQLPTTPVVTEIIAGGLAKKSGTLLAPTSTALVNRSVELRQPQIALASSAPTSGSGEIGARKRPALEVLKSIGTAMFGIAIFIGIALVVPMLLVGGALTTVAMYPYLVVATQYVLPVCGTVLLPLTGFRRTRVFALTAIYACSYLFGAVNWAFGFLVTYHYFGVIGLVVGLFIVGIGVVPIGIVASALHSDWGIAGNLVLGAVLTYGARVFALYQAEKIDRNEMQFQGAG